MATLGQVMVEVGADLSEFQRNMKDVEKSLQQTGKKLEKTSNGFANSFADDMGSATEILNEASDHMKDFQRDLNRTANSATQLDSLPAHLKPFAESLKTTGGYIQEMSKEGVKDLGKLADATIATRVGFDKMTSVSDSGKKAIKMVQSLGEETNITRMAVLGLNRDGTVKLSTTESTNQLEKFQDKIANTRKELEKFRDAGDMGTYQAGMVELNRQIKLVDKAMQGAARGGTAYNGVLRSMGIYTSDMANTSAIAMERMRDSFFNANEMLQKMKSPTAKIQENLARMDVRKLDQQFLGVARSLGKMAKQGAIANVAIKEVGKDASMKDIMNQVAVINAGLANMQAMSIVAGIAVLGLTAALVALSKGPNVGKVQAEQKAITQAYTDALKERAEAIYNFAGLFEHFNPVQIDKEQLMHNLGSQVTVMEDWLKNMASLTKRGVDEGMIAELRAMGPAAAGEIKAMQSMSQPELEKYVKLWQEKHKLAREASMTELEKMKEETKVKVAELQETLKPLGIALEEAKSVWAEAVKPWAESWGEMAAKVVDGVTAIGEFINKINEFNPSITAVLGNIGYLATVFSLLLAPMSIGISKAGGFAVAFGQLWMRIGPVITGFLTIAGTVLILATAIVIAIGSFKKMWDASENLRTALTGVWTAIKTAFTDAITPLKTELEGLKTAFLNMVQGFVGEGGKVGDVWKLMGDAIAKVVEMVTPFIQEYFTNVFKMAVAIIIPLIQGLITAFGFISTWWATNGTQVMTLVGQVQGFIVSAFTAISSFIIAIMPQIMEIVTVAFEIIKDVANEVFPLILKLVDACFPIILAIIKAVMPIVLMIIKSVWNNVKNVIVSTINIILNIIDMFKNIFAGKWGAVWENVKAILKNALILIWNAIQLMYVGKLVKGVVSAGKLIVAGVKGAWTTAKKTVISLVTGIKDNAVKTITNMKITLKTIWEAMRTGAISTVTGLKTSVKVIWTSMKSIASTAFTNVKNAIIKPITAAKDKVLEIIGKIKSAFSGMKIKIPKFNLPSIVTGTKKVLGATIPTFSFGKEKEHATGTILTGRTQLGGGHVGGEAGTEAIMPLGRKRYFSPWASMVSELLADNLNAYNGEGSGGVINKFEIAQLVVREEADIEKLANALEKKQRIQARAKGQFAY